MINEKLEEELKDIRYRQKLILSALRNLLAQNNTNGVNDFLISRIEKSGL